MEYFSNDKLQMLAGRRNMIGYKTIPRQQLENILTNLSASTATPKAATRPKPCTPTPVPRPKKHTPDLKMCTSICHKNCTPKVQLIRKINSYSSLLQNYAPFTDCISKINYMQIDNAKVLDMVMLMYNLIKYSNNYAKTPGIILQC